MSARSKILRLELYLSKQAALPTMVIMCTALSVITGKSDVLIRHLYITEMSFTTCSGQIV
jgi:hypothetical protein